MGAEVVEKKSAGEDNFIVNLDVLGRTGLPYYGGRIYQERNYKLRGIQGVRLYQEMSEQDAIVGTILFLIETFIASAEWRVEPAEEKSKEARYWAKFVEECFEDMSHTFEDLLSEIMTFLIYGWAYFEQCFKTRNGLNDEPTSNSKFDDGMIGWRKIAPRAQDTLYAWDLDPDGGIRGFYQSAPPDFVITYIPIEKSLLFRTKPVHNNPEGRSALRNAVRSYHFVKRLQEIEAIGVERDLAGYPVMEVPEELLMKNATAGQTALRAQLQNIVEQVRRDEREGILLPASLNSEGKPTGYKFSLLSTGGRRNLDTGEIIKRYETRICQTVLAEFVMLGMDKVGSYSLASSKTNTFSVALGSWMDKICAVINRFAIPRLLRLNGAPPEFYPQLRHGDLETPPLDEIAQYVLSLAQAGVNVSDAKTERKLRELAKLPQREEASPAALPTNPDGTPMTPEQAAAAGVQPPTPTPPGAPPAAPGAPPLANAQPPSGQSTDPVDSLDTIPLHPWSGTPDGDGDEYEQGKQSYVRTPPLPSLSDKPLPMLALNGGQIKSMMDIVTAAAARKIPRDSAMHMMRLAFPYVDPQRIEQVLGDIGASFEPTPDRVPSVPPSNPPPGPPPFTPVGIANSMAPGQDARPGPKKPLNPKDPAGRMAGQEDEDDEA